jgi:hypothetical protein
MAIHSRTLPVLEQLQGHRDFAIADPRGKPPRTAVDSPAAKHKATATCDLDTAPGMEQTCSPYFV